MWRFVPDLPTAEAYATRMFQQVQYNALSEVLWTMENKSRRLRGQIVLQDLTAEEHAKVTSKPFAVSQRIYLAFNNTAELVEVLEDLKRKMVAPMTVERILLYNVGAFLQTVRTRR